MFPWNQPRWDRLVTAHRAGRLGHAVLLVGAEGLGKHQFGLELCGLLLCEHDQETSAPCGSCRGCRLLAAGSHPDYLSVTVEEGRQQITVDQIRALAARLALKSHTGGAKVAFVYPADAMNLNAANSLLKTLEEPPEGTLLVLTAWRLAALPATVISRCQRIAFTAPPGKEALAWLSAEDPGADWAELLRAARGAPLRARELKAMRYDELAAGWHEDIAGILLGERDPCAVAAGWAKQEPRVALAWLEGWVRALICARVVGKDVNQVTDAAATDLQNALCELNIVKLLRYLERLSWILPRMQGSLNLALALEGVLIPWARRLEGIPTGPELPE